MVSAPAGSVKVATVWPANFRPSTALKMVPLPVTGGAGMVAGSVAAASGVAGWCLWVGVAGGEAGADGGGGGGAVAPVDGRGVIAEGLGPARVGELGHGLAGERQALDGVEVGTAAGHGGVGDVGRVGHDRVRGGGVVL